MIKAVSALALVIAALSLSGCADTRMIAYQAIDQDCFTGHDGGWTCFWASDEGTVIERRYCYQELGGVTCYTEPRPEEDVTTALGTSGY